MHPEIEEIGYHCRDYFLGAVGAVPDLPLGRAGALDPPARRRHLGPRRRRALPGAGHPGHRHPRGRSSARANLDYLDPAAVDVDALGGRPGDARRPRAGEVLYRLRPRRHVGGPGDGPITGCQTPAMRLLAGSGLIVDIAEDGTVRSAGARATGSGPGRPTRAGPSPDPVEVHRRPRPGHVGDGGRRRRRPLLGARLRRTPAGRVPHRGAGRRRRPGHRARSTSRRSGGRSSRPADRADGGAPDGLRAVAFQHCEFGLPSNAGADLDGFFLLPHRPPTGWPLVLAAPDGRTLLLAALDAFHDQTVGLNGGTVRCGWHGDLDSVPAGFATDLGGDRRRRPPGLHRPMGPAPPRRGPAPSDRGAGPTPSAPSPRTGPTTAPPTGTGPSRATTSPGSVVAAVDGPAGRRTCRSAPCSSTRGSIRTRSCGRSTPTSGSCRRRR